MPHERAFQPQRTTLQTREFALRCARSKTAACRPSGFPAARALSSPGGGGGGLRSRLHNQWADSVFSLCAANTCFRHAGTSAAISAFIDPSLNWADIEWCVAVRCCALLCAVRCCALLCVVVIVRGCTVPQNAAPLLPQTACRRPEEERLIQWECELRTRVRTQHLFNTCCVHSTC